MVKVLLHIGPEPLSGVRVTSCVWSRLVSVLYSLYVDPGRSVGRTALPASTVALGVWAQPAFLAVASPRFDHVT